MLIRCRAFLRAGDQTVFSGFLGALLLFGFLGSLGFFFQFLKVFTHLFGMFTFPGYCAGVSSAHFS